MSAAKRTTAPAEERTADMIAAGFAEVEAIMGERGLSPEQITSEFLAHVVFRMWGEEDRSALYGKVAVAAKRHVEGLFDSIGA